MTNIRLAELSKRLYWFINLRWLAIVGVIVAINFAKYFQDFPLPYNFLYLLSGILTIFNISYLAFYNFSIKSNSTYCKRKQINAFANFQVLIDLIILTLLLYGSGGLHSPFIYYYVFHMVIASILLSPIWAFIQGGVAIMILGIVIILSNYDVIPNYSLPGFSPPIHSERYDVFILSKLCGLISTIFILIFISTSISKQLNNKEILLEKANEELTLVNEEKSKYILQVTHELRSPLAAVQGYLKVALEGYVGPVEGKLKEMLNNINNRVTNMLIMVNELLDLANLKRPEKNALVKEVCNVKNEVNKAIHLFENELVKKNINLQTKIDDDMEISVDVEQFYILLTNIINNAIKYSYNDGNINIDASKSGNSFLIKIQDNGIGIHKNDLKNIFQEYFRSQNAINKEKDGTGLGLAIVESIVKKHCGNVRVESELDKGTTFCIELPA